MAKIIAAAHVPKPVPVTLTGKPAIKGASVIKNPFMIKSLALLCKKPFKVTKILATKTMMGEGNNDNESNDDDDVAMDIDTGSLVVDTKFLELLHLEEASQGVLKEAKKVVRNIALAPSAKLEKLPFPKLDYKSLYNSNRIVQALTVGAT
ncbi:hypothetical protein C0995_009215, partial [Termitomyces sp. Mi166